ncbi:MAG TPA: FKBP-type peptidyl-prolyl cis-trans isomerase [Caulobacteraceae bacterium]
MPPFRLTLAAAVLALTAAGAGPGFAQSATPSAVPAAAPVTHTLPTIHYEVLRYGDPTGAHPTRNDTVQVNYEVKLKNGTPIESSYAKGQPSIFKLTDLIPAWQIVVPLMRPGDEWLVHVPAEFAYGDPGGGPIPGGADLEFRIQLLAVMPRTR